MTPPALQSPAIAATGLPQAWRGHQCWRLLDTDFADGARFLELWQAWACDAQAATLLHYVAITAEAPDRATLIARMARYPAIAAQAAELDRQYFGLLPGFHRLELQQQRVRLTLCIGPLHPMLSAQRFVADTVFLCTNGWDRWRLKALVRLCRRGTALSVPAQALPLHDALMDTGFVLGPLVSDPAADEATARGGSYQPRWDPGSSRSVWRNVPMAVSDCAVIGAGLAGAMVAQALSRRAWQVRVLDAAQHPAAGASSLPVGLLAPQLSRDDSARSRLSRAGARLTLQMCARLLREGEDWCGSGALELHADGRPSLPADWPSAGRQWSAEASANDRLGAHGIGLRADSATWHAKAGWIKPAALVRAALAYPGVQFSGDSAVQSIHREAGQWLLFGAHRRLLSRSRLLVVAAAGATAHLIGMAADALQAEGLICRRLARMGSVDGQLSWAEQASAEDASLPRFPVNGEGSLIAHVPMAGTHAWCLSATYEVTPAGPPDPHSPGLSEQRAHQDNLARLSRLLPGAAQALAPRFDNDEVQAWRGTRCTSTDRLPALGALDAGPVHALWVSAAMGSRGLTYAVLCAELLAAQLGGEPLPLESELAHMLDASRTRLRAPDGPAANTEGRPRPR